MIKTRIKDVIRWTTPKGSVKIKYNPYSETKSDLENFDMFLDIAVPIINHQGEKLLGIDAPNTSVDKDTVFMEKMASYLKMIDVMFMLFIRGTFVKYNLTRKKIIKIGKAGIYDWYIRDGHATEICEKDEAILDNAINSRLDAVDVYTKTYEAENQKSKLTK